MESDMNISQIRYEQIVSDRISNATVLSIELVTVNC